MHEAFRERSCDFRYSVFGIQLVPVPPLIEQRAIADYLDCETAKIDKVATLTRQENDLLWQYRTRLISDVITGKVDVRDLAGKSIEAEA